MNEGIRFWQVGSLIGLFRKLSKVVLIGLLGSVLYCVMSTTAVFFGGDPQISSLLSYGISVPVIYVLHSRISFESQAPHRTAFPRYLTVQIMALALSFILPRLLASPGTANAITFVVVAIIIGMLNLLALLLWAFAMGKE